jgi:hypothetical protein
MNECAAPDFDEKYTRAGSEALNSPMLCKPAPPTILMAFILRCILPPFSVMSQHAGYIPNSRVAQKAKIF